MDVLDQIRHKWTRDTYERMVRNGMFLDSDSVELLEGEIVEMSPQNPEHAAITMVLADWLRSILSADLSVRIQCPLAVNADSEPEPDIAIVRGQPRDYLQAHPNYAELVVEVANTSLSIDRAIKGRIYASAGIPEYWIVDLSRRQIEVYKGPRPEGYQSQCIQCVDGEIAPDFARDRLIAVRALI